MKKLLVAVLLALVAAGWTWDDGAHAASRTVYIVDQSTIVHNTDLRNALPAFQAAVSQDFASVWGQDANLVLTDTPPAGAWWITVEDWTDVGGALGYHDFGGGFAYARVFAGTTLNWSDAWQSVFTHELFEMLADPYVDRLVLGKKLWLVEVSDPVEDDQFNYARPAADGSPVPISDFAFPAWYRKTGKGPFDFARRVKKRGQILEGGYASFWTGFQWQQVYGRRHG